MIHFTDDAFKEIAWSNLDKLPYTAQWQLKGLFNLARHEGVTVAYASKAELPNGYDYDPGLPRILFAADVSWPDMRWALAVAVGMHFTRGIYLEEEAGLCRNLSRWKEQARAWATQWLAVHLSDTYTSHYPNFSASGEHLEACGGPKIEQEVPNLSRYQSETCRGSTKDGSRCSKRPTSGTAFCRHHQNQGQATLASIVQDLGVNGDQ